MSLLFPLFSLANMSGIYLSNCILFRFDTYSPAYLRQQKMFRQRRQRHSSSIVYYLY